MTVKELKEVLAECVDEEEPTVQEDGLDEVNVVTGYILHTHHLDMDVDKVTITLLY